MVRKVLTEGIASEGAPRQTNRISALWVVALAAMAVAMGLAVGLLAMDGNAPSPRLPAAKATPKPALVVPVVPIPPPLPPKPTGVGTPQTLALGPGAALYLTTDKYLIRADRDTLRTVWTAPLRLGAEGSIVASSSRVAFAAPQGVAFLDSATGEPISTFLFRTGGFKVAACLAGTQQVLVRTVFDGTLRFDIESGTRAAGQTSCTHQDALHCDAPQRCGWDSAEPPGLNCRYFLKVGPSTVTFCEEEGTKAKLVVKRFNGKTQWKTVRGTGAATNPGYASVVDGLLIVSENHFLEAFDAASGERRWSARHTGGDGAVVSDGHQLYVGQDDTLIRLDAKTGAETGRFEASNP
jgi:PQQ-like domain